MKENQNVIFAHTSILYGGVFQNCKILLISNGLDSDQIDQLYRFLFNPNPDYTVFITTLFTTIDNCNLSIQSLSGFPFATSN